MGVDWLVGQVAIGLISFFFALLLVVLLRRPKLIFYAAPTFIYSVTHTQQIPNQQPGKSIIITTSLVVANVGRKSYPQCRNFSKS